MDKKTELKEAATEIIESGANVDDKAEALALIANEIESHGDFEGTVFIDDWLDANFYNSKQIKDEKIKCNCCPNCNKPISKSPAGGKSRSKKRQPSKNKPRESDGMLFV